jgi:hypothetical protein
MLGNLAIKYCVRLVTDSQDSVLVAQMQQGVKMAVTKLKDP